MSKGSETMSDRGILFSGCYVWVKKMWPRDTGEQQIQVVEELRNSASGGRLTLSRVGRKVGSETWILESLVSLLPVPCAHLSSWQYIVLHLPKDTKIKIRSNCTILSDMLRPVAGLLTKQKLLNILDECGEKCPHKSRIHYKMYTAKREESLMCGYWQRFSCKMCGGSKKEDDGSCIPCKQRNRRDERRELERLTRAIFAPFRRTGE